MKFVVALCSCCTAEYVLVGRYTFLVVPYVSVITCISCCFQHAAWLCVLLLRDLLRSMREAPNLHYKTSFLNFVNSDSSAPYNDTTEIVLTTPLPSLV